MLYQILIASVLGGVVSLTGGAILLWREAFAKRISLYLVSFATGSLLGAAFLELIPEAIEGIGSTDILIFTIAGLLTFFVFEKFLMWYHCHDQEVCAYHTFSAQTVLLGDTLHNFLDGIAIAFSFMIGPAVGIATTVAVFFHEIPQEIGDFGVLLNAGYKRSKILLYNFLTAVATVAGAALTFFFAQFLAEEIQFYALAIAAGSFIYIAAADLIPELRHKGKGFDLGHIITLLMGVIVVFALTLILPE